ncbi:MAG: RNA methyltransferase [Desulfobacterales bacterium]
MTEKNRLEHISIILNKPRFPENIGAAARVVKNMGIGRLVVVDPAFYDRDRIKTMATHAAGDVVADIRLFDTLAESVADQNYIVGTTARLGGERPVVYTPKRMADKLIPISRKNAVAVVFGPEDRGLTNEEIRLCHDLVNIPTADFSSLNLAQAVMVMCYELFSSAREEPTAFAPRLAGRYELDGMYEQLKDILVRIDYIKPDNPDYWMNNLRRFFSRIGLRAREVKIIRGLCRQVDWYARKCYEDGLKDREER